MDDFDSLDTVKFQQRMKPAALNIYKEIFPGCELEDLREQGIKVHILDKEFGIDSLIKLPAGQWISLQEKYRRNYSLKWADFTLEYKNAVGTPYEEDGEYFKLGAQLYSYMWANEDETDFVRWFVLDIAKSKVLIESYGGIEKIGKLNCNSKHGRASFYSIPLEILRPAILMDSCSFYPLLP